MTRQLPPEAATQAGLFRFTEAVAAGWTTWDVERAHSTGQIVDLAYGVFVPASDLVGLTPLARHLLEVRAQQLAHEVTWYAARRSAALIHDVPLIGSPPTVPQLLRDPEGTRAKGHSRHARVGPLPEDQREEVGGILVCSVARTVVDIARHESFRNGVVAADAALRAGVSKDDLRTVLRGQRRWPGVIRARSVVDFADPRSESPGESVTRVALHAEGIEIPEPQVEVWRYGAFVARLDFLFRRQLLALESDGAMKFTDAGVLPALLARAESVRDCGIAVLHTSWDETFRRTGPFGQRVRQRLAESDRRLAHGVELRSTTVSHPRAA